MAEVTEKESSKKRVSLADLLKMIGAFVGVVAVFVPLWTGILNYKQSVRETLDVNFRTVVEKLSSNNEQDRLAAAASLGTFIRKEEYHDEAVDILINRISIELDYNVLNTIMGSLKRAETINNDFFQKLFHKDENGALVQKLLDLNRNLFIQEYALEKWKNDWGKIHQESFGKYLQERNALKKEKDEGTISEAKSVLLKNLEKETTRNWEIYYKRDKDLKELAMHKQASSDFITSFLGESSKYIGKGVLVFKQNSFNYVILIDTNLSNSTITRSTFSSSRIINTSFDKSKIAHTFFTDSDLEKSTFKACDISLSLFDNAILKDVDFSGSNKTPTKFDDVFFAGSDLTGAKFQRVNGLKPIYFYGAKIDKTIFDDTYKKIPEEQAKIHEDDFIKYVLNSELSQDKKDTLLQTIDILRKRYDYFINAVLVYVWGNNKDAKIAALAAYMTASNKTTASMIDYIDKQSSLVKNKLSAEASNEPSEDEKRRLNLAFERLSNLKEELIAKTRNIDEIMAEREKLRTLNLKYSEALEEGDINVFTTL